MNKPIPIDYFNGTTCLTDKLYANGLFVCGGRPSAFRHGPMQMAVYLNSGSPVYKGKHILFRTKIVISVLRPLFEIKDYDIKLPDTFGSDVN